MKGKTISKDKWGIWKYQAAETENQGEARSKRGAKYVESYCNLHLWSSKHGHVSVLQCAVLHATIKLLAWIRFLAEVGK